VSSFPIKKGGGGAKQSNLTNYSWKEQILSKTICNLRGAGERKDKKKKKPLPVCVWEHPEKEGYCGIEERESNRRGREDSCGLGRKKKKVGTSPNRSRRLDGAQRWKEIKKKKKKKKQWSGEGKAGGGGPCRTWHMKGEGGQSTIEKKRKKIALNSDFDHPSKLGQKKISDAQGKGKD